MTCKRLITAISKAQPATETLKAAWIKDLGASHVWISKISQSFSSFRYLTKYLTKLHRIEWTDRHVSYSKGFFRPEDLERMSYPVRDVLERSELHPWKYLADNFPDEQVGIDDKGQWRLPYKPSVPATNVPMSELGLRIPEPITSIPQPKQRWILPDADADERDFISESF